MNTSQKKHGAHPQVWEDLVLDFLDTACSLPPDQTQTLLSHLQHEWIQAEAIEIHSCFSIQNKLIVIASDENPAECWIFNPASHSLIKTKLY